MNKKKCEECGKNFNFYEDVETKCDSCVDYELKARNLLKSRGVTIEQLRGRSGAGFLGNKLEFYTAETDYIQIHFAGRRLEKLLPAKLKKEYCVKLGRWATNIETGKKVDGYKDLIKRVIDNKFDVDKIVNDLYDQIIRSWETEKIKVRQEKLKLREEAEKNYFGATKTKRIPLTDEEKESIFEKFNNECAVCGTREGLHIHHKNKKADDNRIQNLVVLCGICHKKTHMKVR